MLRFCRNLHAPKLRAGFTIVEMLVVVGILGILMSVMLGGLGRARRQARIAKANAEIRELVNAILAYEASDGELDMLAETPKEATEESLRPLIGASGGTVYLDAPITAGAFRDPWGTPYRFRIIEESFSAGDSKMTEGFTATVTFPNREYGMK